MQSLIDEKNNLSVPFPIGFGCYRVGVGQPQQKEAMLLALRSGIRLIDTSSNYADGSSEELVGEVLGSGELARHEVFVVSKAGYIQGRNQQVVEEAAKAGQPFSEIVEYADGLHHCIHPDFLKDQLERSLQRLGLQKLDAFLLHNPEYYMSWCEANQVNRGQASDEYYRRVSQAFAYLEEEARAGRIGCYGVSSNTFVEPSAAYAHTSLSRVWNLAGRLGPDHHFRIAQFPLNLYEPGAALEPNQPGGKTLLEFAAQNGISVLINRPLNAIVGERLTRLADYGRMERPGEQQVVQALMEFKDSEDNLMRGLVPNLGLPKEHQQQLKEQLALCMTLLQNWQKFAGLHHYLGVQSGWVIPRLNAVAGTMARLVSQRHDALRVLDAHLGKARQALQMVENWYMADAAGLSARIKPAAAQADADWAQAATLSQLAIRAVRSSQGVSAVLVGMRRPEYVRDVLAELERPVEQKNRKESWRSLNLPKE